MTTVPIRDVAAHGIILDSPSHLLPPGAWSDGYNVRFKDGRVRKSEGYTTVFGAVQVTPYFLKFVPAATQDFWVYCGLAKIYAIVEGTHYDITNAGGDYTGSVSSYWTGGSFNGVTYFNNGADAPQQWVSPAAGTPLTDLSNWPAATTCTVLTSLGNFMVALGLVESGSSYPHSIMWSHPADPGTVPSSWDYTDATKQAGRNTLPDTEKGVLRGGLQLGNSLIIYKEEACYTMRFIGGNDVFDFADLFNTYGAVGPYAMGYALDDKAHLVITSDDIYLHDGTRGSARSVLDARMREWFRNNFNKTKAIRAHVRTNYLQRETWACIPVEEEEYPTKAIVYSWSGQLTLIDIPPSAPGDTAPFLPNAIVSWDSDTDSWDDDGATWDAEEGGTTWNTADGTWDERVGTWDQETQSAAIRQVLLPSPVDDAIYLMDVGYTANGMNYMSFVKRTAMPLSGISSVGNPVLDHTVRKQYQRLWPIVDGAPIEITVGAQETETGLITWQPSFTFRPGVDRYVPTPFAAGSYLCLEISDVGDAAWSFSAFSVDMEVIGR